MKFILVTSGERSVWLAVAALLALHSQAVFSSEWSMEPSISAGVIHDDNIRLETTGGDSVSGMTLRPEMKLSRRTETSDIAVSGQVNASRYDKDAYDYNELMLDLSSSFKHSERSTFGLDAGFSRQPTHTTEEEDSGRIEVDRDRETMTLNPSWDYQLSQSSQLQVAYSATDVDYSGSTSLIDYRYQTLSGTYLIRQSEKNQFSFSLNASRYRPADGVLGAIDYVLDPFGNRIGLTNVIVPATNKTDSYGFYIGASRDFSETLKGSLSVGLSESENTQLYNSTQFQRDEYGDPAVVNTVINSTLTTVNASLSKEFELTTLTANFSNSNKPSSNGVLNESTELGINIKRKLTPKLQGVFDLKAIRSKNELLNGNLDRDYYSTSLQAHWQLTKWWRMIADYRYRYQKYDTATDSADSNKFMVSLRYTWPKMAVSR